MRKLTLALCALAVLATTPDAGAKKKHKPKPKTIQTGDPLPKKPVKNAQCHDKGATRFVGSGPSTPLAMVKKGRIEEPGVACCAPWAVKGAVYKTLDAYGQIVGEASIAGGEGYDVSQCYELQWSTTKGKPGVGLYVDASFKPPKSVAWAPSAAEHVALQKTVDALEHAMVKAASYGCTPDKPLALDERAQFFSFETDDRVGHFAVVGGPLLIVAELQKDGRWIAQSLGLRTNTCQSRAYKPRAVFDMNGDGAPEIVVYEDLGDGFGDLVLGFENGGYRQIAAAVGGSTA